MIRDMSSIKAAIATVRWKRFAALAGVAVLGLTVLFLWLAGVDLPALRDGMLHWLKDSHPAWLVSALVLLPLVGVPVSPFMILAGAKWGIGLGWLVCVAGLAVHFTIAWALAVWLVRDWIFRLLQWLAPDLEIPDKTVRRDVAWILFFRITPGIPLFVQNYALGLARVRFAPYMIYSMAVQSVYAMSFILFGSAIFTGRIGQAAAGVLLAVAALVAFKLIRTSIEDRRNSRAG